jgi:uncharacterized protein with HEPN domain
MPLPDRVYLSHMLEAIRHLEEYAARVTRAQFDDDPMIQDGFVRQITVLGEAAGKVSKGFAASHPEIPWPDITGIRHKLVHDYFTVDIDVVWDTATVSAPNLKPLIEAAHRAEDAEDR